MPKIISDANEEIAKQVFFFKKAHKPNKAKPIRIRKMTDLAVSGKNP